MTYTTLKADIASYLHRTDLTATIPTFISLAESYLFRELNVKELQVSADGATIAGGYGALPADFGAVSRITITNGGFTYTLDYVSVPDVSTSVDAYPKYYSLENNQIRIFGAGVGQAYTLYYIPVIAPLSGTVATNWILDNAQELYLYASCLEGARYIRDAAEVARLADIVSMSIESTKRFSERRGLPSTGSLQIKPRRG